jgi:Skp family chaperone for outer membrane proteins
MKTLLCSISILVSALALSAHAAIPTAAQVNMTKHIDNAITWSKHLKEEVSKGTKSNAKEIEGDLAGILSFTTAMSLTADQIIFESPSEKKEGHFTEMQRFQRAATAAAKDFPLAKSGKAPNFSAMKVASKNILENLENAKHWHDLEVSEIEKNQKD